MRSLAHRSHEPELMDGDDVSQGQFAACVEDLAQVNTLTLARGPTLRFIDAALAVLPAGEVLHVVDVGFGAGDMLRAIARRTRGRPIRLTGYDINPRSEPVARRLSPPGMSIDWRTGDAFAGTGPVDVVISSLVTHHMGDDEITAFLRWMEATARRGWFVNDLHRHWFAYYGFAALSAAMRWHPFVRHDGPLSIARAFRRPDWQALLEQAGVADAAQVRWRFPFRYCVERRKW